MNIEIKQLKLRRVNNAIERIGRGDKRQSISLLLNISSQTLQIMLDLTHRGSVGTECQHGLNVVMKRDGDTSSVAVCFMFKKMNMAIYSLHRGNSRARAKFRQGVFWFHRTSSQPGKVVPAWRQWCVSNHIHLYKSQNVLSA